MPSNPDSITLRVVQVDAPADKPWDEPINVLTDGVKIAAVYFVETGKDDLLAALWRDGADLRFRDETNPGTANGGYTLTELLASTGGVTETSHKTLRHLIHFIESNSPGDGFGAGPYASEVLPSGDPFPTSETWFESAADKTAGTGKICRWEGTYNANKTFATETWIVYQSDGTSKSAEATDTISYSGPFETGRSRAVTVY